VRRRRKAKRPPSERIALAPVNRPNAVRSMDFVSDALANGHRLKCLTVAWNAPCSSGHQITLMGMMRQRA
jgi:hypothetical protein